MDLLALYCHDLHKIFVAIKVCPEIITEAALNFAQVECPVEDEGEAMDLPRTLEVYSAF